VLGPECPVERGYYSERVGRPIGRRDTTTPARPSLGPRFLVSRVDAQLELSRVDGHEPDHGERQLRIGAELYDLWLDSLLKTVKVCDAGWSEEVEQAWEAVMGIGIGYLCSRYNS